MLCRNMAAIGESGNIAPQLPGLRFGFGLATALFVLEIVFGVQKELARGTPGARAAGSYAAALTLVVALVSTAFILHCISAYHCAVSEIEGWSHAISPKRAVRFHFIPIFNFYWNFRWPIEMARFINWRMQRRRMSGTLLGASVLAGFLIAALLDASIGLAVIFSAFAYLSRSLRDAFAAPPVPPSQWVTNGLDGGSSAT
jgi:hypothetical protein